MNRKDVDFLLTLLELEGIISKEQQDRILSRINRIGDGISMHEALQTLRDMEAEMENRLKGDKEMSIIITFKGNHRTDRKTTTLMVCKKALQKMGYIVADYPDGHLLVVSKPDLTEPKEEK